MLIVNFGVAGQSTGRRENTSSIASPSATLPIVNITTDGPSRGNKNAPVTIVLFSSFQCPYSKQAIKQVDEILNTHGDKVRFVYKHFPLNEIQAITAARASVCSQEQGKFWEYQDALFQSTDLSAETLRSVASRIGIDVVKFDGCISTDISLLKIEQDMDEGAKIGVRGTPAYVINGKLILGLQGLEDLQNYIDRELSNLSKDNGNK
jgi:protein-disulfide isomerase